MDNEPMGWYRFLQGGSNWITLDGAAKSRAEMIGEAFREVGVLAAVFIPLDHLFAENPVMPWWGAMVATVAYGGGFFVLGMLVEEARE